MPKVEIIRNGAKRSVSLDQRVAHALVRQGSFRYADSKVSKPKRKAKVQDAPSSDDKPVILNKTTSEPVEKEEGPQVHPQPEKIEELQAALKNTTMSAGKPMSSARFAVKPSRQLTRDQLVEMTKADLKILGQKLGVDLKPAEPKDVWVNKLNRYMRRDMRAAK